MNRVKSYYVDDETVEAIKEHARQNHANLSWALRDLVRRGIAAVREKMREEERR